MRENRQPAYDKSHKPRFFFRINWPLFFGGLIVFLVALIALVGPDLAPRDPLEENAIFRVGDGWKIPPFAAFTPGFLLGSDQFGRDLLSRLLWAVRPTMTMVFTVAFARLLLGVIMGLAAGWFTGWTRRAVDTIIGIALSVPPLMVALGAIAAVGIEGGIWAFIIGLSINGWVETARLVREQTRLVKGQLYVEAARALGASDSQVIFRHVVRQIMPMVWMLFAFEISGTLMVTAALGFLGYYIGGDVWVLVDDFAARAISGTPELGQMLASSWVRTDEPWAMIAVGSVVFFTVLGFNLMGRGLRRRLSVKRMSKHSPLARLQEGISTHVTDPISQWMEQRIWFPLRRQTERRTFYPLLAALTIIIGGGLIGLRWQTTQPSESESPETVLEHKQLWSTERRDPQGTLWSPVTGPDTPEIQWVFKDPDGFSGGPVVTQEGVLFVTSKTGTLYALDPAGNVRWQVSLPGSAVGTPALGKEEWVYVTDQSGSLSAFTLAGDLEWRFQGGNDNFATSGPIVGPNGAIYYMVRGGIVQAVSSSGTGLWQTRALYDPTYSPPRLSPDGEWLFVNNAVLNAHDGTLQAWETATDVDRYIIGADGQYYLQSGNEIIQWRAINSGDATNATQGIETVRSTTWDYRKYTVRDYGGPTDAGVTPKQLVWMLYASSREDTRIVWVDMGGRTVGNAHYAQRETDIIAVDHDATTFACGTTRSGNIECLALKPGSNDPLWQVSLAEGNQVGGGALVPGRLYIAAQEGALYAIGAEQSPESVLVTEQTTEPAKTATKSLGPELQHVAWTFEDETGFHSDPAVATDGTLYISSKAGILYALDLNGKILWQAALPDVPVGPPVLDSQGDIYQADQGGNLSRFAPDGSLRWRFQPPESKPSTVGPLIAPDGTIYYTVGGSVQAVSPAGEGLWQTRTKTFRNLTPLQLSPEHGLLFFADDIFSTVDGTRLELESQINADQFIAGKDGQLYLRDEHTVMQWQRKDAKVEIIQSAQWDYSSFGQTAPNSSGVTQDGIIWMAYTKWRGDIAWIDPTGQVLRTVHTGFDGSQIFTVSDPSSKLYFCGFRNRPFGVVVADVHCYAYVAGSEVPSWQIKLEKSEGLSGGALAPGRMYLATQDGVLYAIGEGGQSSKTTAQETPVRPANVTGEVTAPPAAQVAWIFPDPALDADDGSAGFVSAPSISANGTVYISSRAGTLYALDPAGNILWETTLPDAPVGSTVLDSQGDIYQADKGGSLSRFAPDGSLRWRFQPPESKSPTVGPLIAPDGTIYYTVGGSVQAVSPAGEGLWQTRTKTFRNLTPLQFSPEQGWLFFADDVFRVEDGTRLEFDSRVNADQFIAGRDGQLYLRDEHTVMQWQLKDSKVEIIQSAQWDYESFTRSATPPQNAGVTREGVIWTSYYGGNGIVWLDAAGKILGTTRSGIQAGTLVDILDKDATAYVCGWTGPGPSVVTPTCAAFVPGDEQPIWQVDVEIDSGINRVGEILGGVIVPGRLYAASSGGYLFAVGQKSAPSQSAQADQPTTPEPAVEPSAEDQPSTPDVPQPAPTAVPFPADAVIAGNRLTYTLPIVNRGPSDALGVIVTDTLPSGMTLISATPSQGAGCFEADKTITCLLGDLANGASAAITTVVLIDPLASGIISHSAVVRSSSTDPNAADNEFDLTTTVRGQADLGVTIFDAPDPAIAGSLLTYTLSITNHGPGDATGLSIANVLPISSTLVAARTNQDLDCLDSDGILACALGGLPNAASTTVTILVKLDAALTGAVTYSVAIAANEPDYNPADNSAEEQTVVNAEANMTITR